MVRETERRMQKGAEGGGSMEEEMWDMQLCLCFSVLIPLRILNTEECAAEYFQCNRAIKTAAFSNLLR